MNKEDRTGDTTIAQSQIEDAKMRATQTIDAAVEDINETAVEAAEEVKEEEAE